jgi:hypothetical protein
MQKRVIWLRGAAMAAIAAGLISLPMMSVAQARQRGANPNQPALGRI